MMMQYVQRLLENTVFVATSTTTAFVAGGLTLFEKINSWLGLVALLASIFSASAVGVYHLWKLFSERRKVTRGIGKKQEGGS